RRFKMRVMKSWPGGIRDRGWAPYDTHLWHRSYNDKIIRNDEHLQRTRAYILANPARWLERHHSGRLIGASAQSPYGTTWMRSRSKINDRLRRIQCRPCFYGTARPSPPTPAPAPAPPRPRRPAPPPPAPCPSAAIRTPAAPAPAPATAGSSLAAPPS